MSRSAAAPLLRAALSARQLDADRFATKDDDAEPRPRSVCRRCARCLAAIAAAGRSRRRSSSPPSRSCWAARPLQDIVAGLYAGSGGHWTVRRLPGISRAGHDQGVADGRRLSRPPALRTLSLRGDYVLLLSIDISNLLDFPDSNSQIRDASIFHASALFPF